MSTLEEVADQLGPLPRTDVPLALLPVQVQTRFVTRDGTAQLLLRVYPDEIHVERHDPRLTAAEVQWGRAYWQLVWPLAERDEQAQAAWDRLADRFGARRAAWVARRTTPSNLSARPDTPPDFPDPGEPAGELDLVPARARLLPDRWVVAGFRGEERVLLELGRPVTRPLPVGLTADDAPAPDVGDDELPLDPGSRWMVDFAAAEGAGMGLRVVLDDETARAGLDTLLVFGVRGGSEPQADADELAAVLEAHRHTGGLAFLAPGTPTNNTAEAGTGYSRRDAGQGEVARVGAVPPRLPAGTDGALTARAFGIAPAHLAGVDGATRTENDDARHMLTALWPATGSYYLGHLTGAPPDDDTPFSEEDLDEARRFVVDHVRPQGPLPALRVGRQPYGLLPVASLDLMTGHTPGAGPGPYLVNLRRLRHFLWRPALERAPRLQPGRQDEDDLVEILRMQPTSVGYRARPAFERHIFAPFEFLPAPLEPELLQHRLQLAIRLSTMGIDGLEWRMLDIIPAEADRALPDRLVDPRTGPDGLPEAAWRAADYLAFLRDSTVADLLAERLPADRFGDGPPAALLYLLLRHAVLLARARTAHRVLARRGIVPPGPLREPVLIDIVGPEQPQTTRTLARVLDLDPALRDRLHILGAADEPEAAELEELRASLDRLADLPADALGRHLAGTLDLFAYRLDAWITALATRQLDDVRRRRPRGLALGGFGWLEDVRPAPRATVEPPPGEQAPLFAATEPGGHLFGPSMAHAAAGAVLRSGFLAGTGAEGAQPFAVDVRSERVRLAQWLLDGVREGRPLEAMLGHRFERGLHDAGLDRFLAGARRVSRLAEVYGAGSAAARQRALAAAREQLSLAESATLADLERVAGSSPADGLVLARLFRDGALPFDRLGSGITTPERRGLESALTALDAAVDALGDALTAESVYQAVRGNVAGAAATVDSVAHGDIAPPELQVARTPRGGTPLTHRLVVLLPRGRPPAGTGPRRARQAAEPALEPWLRAFLGEPGDVRFGVELAVGDTVVHEEEVALSVTGVSHTDALYLSVDASPGSATDLERLIEHAVRRRAPAAVPASAQVRLLHERPATLPPGRLGLGEYLEVLRSLRETVLAARGIDGRDLAPAEAVTAEPGVDLAELRARADAAVAALAAARDRLGTELLRTPPDPAAVEERLVDLVLLGLPSAVPVPPPEAGADREDLIAQARAVEQEAAARLDRLEGLPVPDRDLAEAADQVRHDQDRLRAVFGDRFVALPPLRAAGSDLDRALRASADVQGGDPLQVHSWLLVAARVRPGAARLQTVLTFGGALGRPASDALAVAQLPFRPGARWVGLPDPLAGGFPRGVLSLAVHAPLPVAPDGPCAGLLLDEWVEVVPDAEVTAGVAFQHEAPGARPPQAILLALAPSFRERWDVETLERTLLETLEQARMRALDPQALADEPVLHRGLPALYLSLNLDGDELSVDLTRLGGDG